MIGNLITSFGILREPAARRVLLISLVITFATFALLWGAVGWATSEFQTWFETWANPNGFWASVWTAVIAFSSVIAMGFASIVLFAPLMLAILPNFLDSICQAEEDRHYPGLPTARPQPLSEMVMMGLRLLGITIVFNLLFLPIYLLLLFIPPLNLVAFYLLNGYLIGRGYFELVAVRRESFKNAHVLRKRNRMAIVGAGILITLLLTVPLLNLVIPIVAAAYMVHIYHGLKSV